jgi:hypothetical protein
VNVRGTAHATRATLARLAVLFTIATIGRLFAHPKRNPVRCFDPAAEAVLNEERTPARSLYCLARKATIMGYPGDYLETAVERCALGADGRTHAQVERVLLADGRRLIVKRLAPGDDLMMALTADPIGREYLLWSQGVLDQLPDSVSHAVVDGWLDDDGAVIVMDDLGAAMLGQSCRLSPATRALVIEGAASMHERFLGEQLEGLAPLGLVLSRFAPQRMRLFVGCGSQLPDLVLRGWAAFDDVVTDEMSSAIFALLADPEPLADALLSRPCTLVHGDLAPTNMAIRDGKLVLVDWDLPTAGPAALDIAWMLTRSASALDAPHDEVVAAHLRSAGAVADSVGTRLALLAGLVTSGWRQALEVTEHPDEEVRQRAWTDLDWWVREARLTLEAALI